MILLLGGSGYVGTAFGKLMTKAGIDFRCLSRKDVNYYSRDALIAAIRDSHASFVINAAGFTGKPNVDACELQRTDCVLGNTVLPGIINEACSHCKIAWGHVSSGCIFTGAKPDGRGFTESDSPNFCFRTNNCSFYSGCKALAEECLVDADNTFIWRLRIPFNEWDAPRNYLSKLLHYDRLLNVTNSLSHLDEFVAACLKSWTKRIPFGVYNITNTGAVTTKEVVALIQRHLTIRRPFAYFDDEEQFMRSVAKAPRSSCVLDNSKILATGIGLSHVHDAITHSLQNWRPAAGRAKNEKAVIK